MQTKLSPDRLRQIMPDKTALIDLLQVGRWVNEKQKDGSIKRLDIDCLAAFVVRADQQVVMIDLGLVEPINEAVGEWRANYGANLAGRKPEDQPAAKLRRLVWEPLAAHLNGIETVLIAPDGAVAKLSWPALPGAKPGSYLIQDIALAVIPVPQMLPELLDNKNSQTFVSNPSLLLVGNVDYGRFAN